MTFDEWTKQRKNTQQAAPSGASSRSESRTASAGTGSQPDLDIISASGGIPTFDQWTAARKKTAATQPGESADLDSVAKELELLKTVKQESDLLRRKAATAATSVSSYITDRQAEIYRQYGTDEEINRKIWDYEGKLKYHRLSDNEDYAEKSKYYESDRNAVQKWAANMIADEYEDRAYTYINTGSLPKGVGLIDEGDYKPLTTMTETEKKNFNYLYRTAGRQTAGEYLDHLNLDERYAEQVKEKTAAFAAEHEILGSAASVPLNLLSGLGTVDVALQMAGKKIQEAVTGEYAGPVNYNSKWMLPNAVSSTVRETVATEIADATGTINLDENEHPILSRILNGKSLGDVYQLGMSMVDSAAVAGISKSLNINGTALLGGSAATQGMLDAVEKGASDEQALAMGILNGAFEMLFEKYELESLLGADSNMLRSMAKQALSEGVGEGATTIANTVADAFIMAEKSDWQTKINEYVNAGLSPEKAKKQAFLDMAIQVGWDLAGGIVSGTIMGGGVSAINKAGDVIENVKANHAAGKAVTAVPGGVEALKQASATTAQELNGSAQKGLQRLSDKVSVQQAGGVTAKIRNLVNTQRAGKLYRQTAGAVNELNVKDLTSALEAKGWDKEKAASVAQATATAAVGVPSQEQYRVLESAYADPAYRQAVTEVSREDGTGSMDQRLDRLASVRRGIPAQVETAVSEVPEQTEAGTESRIYNIDEVHQAVETARENGAITEQTYNDIVETLAYTQSDLAEGSIDEADYHGRLGAVMERIGQPDSSRATLEGLQTKVDQDTWDMGQRLAQALGRNIVFYNGTAEENGFYKNGTIYVNTMGSDPVAQTIGHELTHSLEGTKEYGKLKRFVIVQITRQGTDITQLREAKQAEYKRHGVDLKTREAVDREIVAEYVQKHLLTDEQAIMELVRTDRNVAQRILDWLKRVFRRVIGKKDSRERARLESAMRLYEKALRASQSADSKPGTVSMGTRSAQGYVQTDDLTREREATEEAYRRGELSDEDYDSAMDAFEQAEEERLATELEQYSFSGNRNVAKNTKAKYNSKYSKVFFKENVFPSYNESQSNAHELAERWARSDSAKTCDKRLISFHDTWYLIEVFDDMKCGYQIMQKIDAKDYEKEAKFYGTITGYESVQSTSGESTALLREGKPDGGIRDSIDSHESQYGDEDLSVHRVASKQVRWGTVRSEQGPDYGRSRADRGRKNGSSIASDNEADEVQYSFASTGHSADIGSLQVQLHQMQRDRATMLEADADYVAASEKLRYANSFKEKVEARRAMAAAASKIDTADIDKRIADLNEHIRYIRERDVRQHREDQEKYSGTKTAGYSALPDSRLMSLDQDYIKAVASGNHIRIEELVRQAAEAAMPESVVRDQAGNLLKVYHYTNGSFTAFDRNMARTGTEMDGFFFAPDPESTSEYGSNRISAYLNITKIAKDPYLDRKFNDSGTLLREKLAFQGYDGIARTEDGKIYEYMAFDPEQIKSAELIVRDDNGRVIPLSERFNFQSDDIRYSFSDTQAEEQNRRPMEGWYTTDEKALQAKKKGYPVLHGEQIVPFNTWVQAQDRGNYGLVTGMAPNGKLLVSFHNKHDGSMADNVAIPADQLMPVPGAYQMTKEEFASLMESEPLDVGNEEFSEEDMRAMEELYRRSSGEETTVQPVDLEKLPKKAQRHVSRAKNRLLRDLAKRLGVSKFVDRSHLQVAVDEIAQEYLQTGTVSDEKLGELFDKAYQQSVIVDREFFDQHKDIWTKLRKTAVTISEKDQTNIADFSDFKKRNSLRLRIVKEGGLPIDTFYDELRSLAPALFPESITHPADQLVHIAEVSRSIAISYRTLEEFYGPEAPMFRSFARNEFDSAVGEVMGDLHAVRRYADERAAAAAREKAPATVEEAMEVYGRLKKARRVYDRAAAKNLLTREDEMMVGRLLRHEMELEHLDPEKHNVKGITAVFEAKSEYEELCRLITAYKRQLHGKLHSEADRYLETANEWTDKRWGLAYSRETMRRNIYDIVSDRVLARKINETYFEPVHDAEAAAVRLKDKVRDRVRKLELSRKVNKGDLVSEAHAVQLLGEAEDNIRILENARGRMEQRDGKTLADWRGIVEDLWRENPGLDQAKIRGAVNEFRQIYDELFKMMNRVRVENGYEPINYRSGYFPHFQPGSSDGVLAQFGKALGIDTQVVALPTTINGLTHTFKPGIQWFGNAQERLGFNTAYDAVEGFDKYIEGAASVIFQTPNIQRLRALASQIRYRTSDEGIQEQVDAVYEDSRLTDEEKQQKIAAIYEHGKFALGNFVAELDEYTNLLANKKSRHDRSLEAMIGRRAYTFMKWWESRVGANMIAGNISSAMTNFIPLTQAGAQIDKRALIRGMWDTLRNVKSDDGLVGASTFLTNRRGSDPLVQTWVQKASSKAGILMESIDQFVSGSVVRGAYYHNLKRGMSEAEAMHQADIFASGVLADRSKGSMPTIMQASNPLLKLFTQFQLEVNNQFSEVFKDLPRNHREKGMAALVGVFLQYFIGAFAFNELYELLFGRRPALDPIGLLLDTAEDFSDPDVGFGEGMANLAGNAVGELPFSSVLSLIGFETDSGRVPVASSVPDVSSLWDAATKKEWSGKKRWEEASEELVKPLTYLALPFGGNQIAKTWKGIKAVIDGGSYSVDEKGNEILQYPVYNDNPWDMLRSAIQASVMGKSSLPEAKEWVDSGFDSLGAKETAAYQGMLEAGIADREAYALIRDVSKAKETEDLSEAQAKRKALWESDASGDAKALVYYGLIADHDSKAEEDPEVVSEREFIGDLFEQGADPWEVTKAIMGIKDANTLKGAEKSCAKRDAIAAAALTQEEQEAIFRRFVSEKRADDVGVFLEAGLDFGSFVDINNQYARIDAMDIDTQSKANALAHWVDQQGYTSRQEDLIKDTFVYYISMPAKPDAYDKFTAEGLSADEALELTEALGDLEPLTGTDKVTDVQRWRTCVDMFGNESTQLAALAGRMSDDQFAKVEIANNNGVSPDTYVRLKEILPKYDADGNGSLSQKEVKKAIDSMNGLSKKQRAVLWQLSGSKWSSENNPYSTGVGSKVADALADK